MSAAHTTGASAPGRSNVFRFVPPVPDAAAAARQRAVIAAALEATTGQLEQFVSPLALDTGDAVRASADPEAAVRHGVQVLRATLAAMEAEGDTPADLPDYNFPAMQRHLTQGLVQVASGGREQLAGFLFGITHLLALQLHGLGIGEDWRKTWRPVEDAATDRREVA